MKTILTMIMIGGAFALQAQELEENNIDSQIKSLHEQLKTAWGFESVYDEIRQDFIFFEVDWYTWHTVSVNKKALEARDELFSLAHSGTLSEKQMNTVLDALEMGLANPFQGNDYNERKNDRKSEATLRFRASIFRRLGNLAIDPLVPMTIANRDKLIDLLSAPLYDETIPPRQYRKEDGTIELSVPRNFQLVLPNDTIPMTYFSMDLLREAAAESLEQIAQSELLFSREKTIKKLEAQGNETVSPKTEVVPQPELEESTNLLE